jgi:hypothetical protein
VLPMPPATVHTCVLCQLWLRAVCCLPLRKRRALDNVVVPAQASGGLVGPVNQACSLKATFLPHCPRYTMLNSIRVAAASALSLLASTRILMSQLDPPVCLVSWDGIQRRELLHSLSKGWHSHRQVQHAAIVLLLKTKITAVF